MKKVKDWTQWEWLIHCLKYNKSFWTIRHFVNSKILRTHDRWGMKFNKPIRLLKKRYTVAMQTYYGKWV